LKSGVDSTATSVNVPIVISVALFDAEAFTAGSAAIAGSTHCVRASGTDTAAEIALLNNDFFIVPYLS